MTFLKRYGYSALGLNFVIAVIAYEWGTLCYLVEEHVGKNESGALKISMSTYVTSNLPDARPHPPIGCRLVDRRWSMEVCVRAATLFNADFTACTVLISFGALLGKTSPTQLLLLTLVEVVLAKVNEYIGIQLLQVALLYSPRPPAPALLLHILSQFSYTIKFGNLR